jgi:hypothetical protein
MDSMNKRDIEMNEDTYRNAAAKWIWDTIGTDTTGQYIPFVLGLPAHNRISKTGSSTCRLTTPSAVNDPAGTRRRLLTRLCEDATRHLNPTFSKSHPERHDPNRSFGMVVVPANSTHAHLHGFIRVPHADRPFVSETIIQDQQPLTVRMPDHLQWFVRHLRSQMASTNLWLAHDDHVVLPDAHQHFAHLRYLTSPTFEQRHWDQLEWLPSGMFARLHARTQKREQIVA